MVSICNTSRWYVGVTHNRESLYNIAICYVYVTWYCDKCMQHDVTYMHFSILVCHTQYGDKNISVIL